MEDGKITLNYKASNIAKAERAFDKNFLTCITNIADVPSFSDLLFLVQAGGGSEADFDKLVASGIPNLMSAVLEGINNAGFLGEGNEIDVKEATKGLNNTLKSGKTSQNSGDKTKA